MQEWMKKRRFSVSGPPTGIGGRGSQYKLGGGKDMFNKKRFEKVDAAICRWMLHSAVSFKSLKSPFYQTMIDTIAEAGPGVKGPNPYQMSGHFLNQQMFELRDYIQGLKNNWKKFGCTIMCDGWITKTRKPLINFMIYSDCHMIFHKSIDTTLHRKTKEYIFSLMDRVVDEIGEGNVVQVVTDNEASFKAAEEILMDKRKHLYWTPCAAHCIDLMLEDFGKKNHSKQ